jgi:hypothetical protein
MRVQHPKTIIFWSGCWTFGVSTEMMCAFKIPTEFAKYTLSTPYRKKDGENGEMFLFIMYTVWQIQVRNMSNSSNTYDVAFPFYPILRTRLIHHVRLEKNLNGHNSNDSTFPWSTLKKRVYRF